MRTKEKLAFATRIDFYCGQCFGQISDNQPLIQLLEKRAQQHSDETKDIEAVIKTCKDCFDSQRSGIVTECFSCHWRT
ncbi:hypothetical protein GYA49_06365 [Candidatus Beckwithbacteria bacterium]|nr:hypothetical protein [Candidatus Beckwithbacteria bacterium]